MGDEARRGRRLPPPGGSLVSAWVRAAFAARFRVPVQSTLRSGTPCPRAGGHTASEVTLPKARGSSCRLCPGQTQPHCLPGLPRHGGRAGCVGTQGASVLPVPLHEASGAWVGLCAHRAVPGPVSWAYFGFRLPTHHILGGSRARVCGSHSHVWLLASASPAPAVVGICGVNWQVEALSASFK